MGYNAAPLEKLIEEFSRFPGIGRKGATRMAYQVLSMSDEDAAALANAIQNAHKKLHRCRVCQNLSLIHILDTSQQKYTTNPPLCLELSALCVRIKRKVILVSNRDERIVAKANSEVINNG